MNSDVRKRSIIKTMVVKDGALSLSSIASAGGLSVGGMVPFRGGSVVVVEVVLVDVEVSLVVEVVIVLIVTVIVVEIVVVVVAVVVGGAGVGPGLSSERNILPYPSAGRVLS